VAGVVQRQAVRAVVERDGALLMVRSDAGDLKFPGGGVESGETLGAALVREVREECGRTVSAATGVVLVVDERRAAQTTGWVLQMTSIYVACEVGAVEHEPRLDGYEHDLGLRPEWIAAEAAIRANRAVLDAGCGHPWVARELRVLAELVRRPAGTA
jgi:ADP-ribose pyrophosphatase YjhB (NUDIX family)